MSEREGTVPAPSDEAASRAPVSVVLMWCPSCKRLAFDINPLHDCSLGPAYLACPGVPVKLDYAIDMPRREAEVRAEAALAENQAVLSDLSDELDAIARDP